MSAGPPPTPGRYWALFTTAPHVAYYLDSLHRTKREAIAEARKQFAKGWRDAATVVRVDFGPSVKVTQ
jgi:hypothetical protein